MTVIAAVATEDRVVMGCDTRTDYSGTGIHCGRGKIAVLRLPPERLGQQGEPVLLAASGNAAILSVVARGLKLDTPGASDAEAADKWASVVAEAITDLLASANPPLLSNGDANGAGSLDGTLVMAWRQHLWWVYSHTAVRPYPQVLAVGSGTEVALGSLHTSIALGASPRVAVDTAVRLACRIASGCGLDDRGPLIYSTAD